MSFFSLRRRLKFGREDVAFRFLELDAMVTLAPKDSCKVRGKQIKMLEARSSRTYLPPFSR